MTVLGHFLYFFVSVICSPADLISSRQKLLKKYAQYR